MILDHLDNAARYSALNEGLSAGFGFLAQPNIEQLESGRYEIAGDRVYAIVDRTEGRRMDDALLESHRKYVDIQFIIAGSESIGWSPRKGLTTAVEYDRRTRSGVSSRKTSKSVSRSARLLCHLSANRCPHATDRRRTHP
jgi:YhcH/YjgK/YiaL family protein